MNETACLVYGTCPKCEGASPVSYNGTKWLWNWFIPERCPFCQEDSDPAVISDDELAKRQFLRTWAPNDQKDEAVSKTITVCDACLRACCWQGEFMCGAARGAGTVEKSREELAELALENPEYWDLCPSCSAPTVKCRCTKHNHEHGSAK